MRATADRKTQTPNEPTRRANVSGGGEARASLDVDRAATGMNHSRIEGGRVDQVFTVAERHSEADSTIAIDDKLPHRPRRRALPECRSFLGWTS